jgi:hypothetical protein
VDCDARLARYREALEAGTDPTVVARWIAEVQAERRSAEDELRRRRPAAAFTEDDIRAMVKSLGDLVCNLRAADAQRKTDLYDTLGLSLTYEPSKRRVLVEADLGGVRLVSEGGFEPPRPIRPLGPQPSASTKFRHSDGSPAILATRPERSG